MVLINKERMGRNHVLCIVLLCIFGNVQLEGKGIRYICGKNLQIYDITIEECIDGRVFRKPTHHDISSAAENQSTSSGHVTDRGQGHVTDRGQGHVTDRGQSNMTGIAHNISESRQSDGSAPVSDTNMKPNRITRRICRDHEDLLSCNGNIYCGRHHGYQCCGFQTYHPNTQTCCQQTSSIYKIHDEKPEKDNICCGLEVHERGSANLSCVHASTNDKFFQRPQRLTYLRNDQRLCSNLLHVFQINIGKIRKRGDVTAVVKMWDWIPMKKLRMKKSGLRKKKMFVKFDKYTKRSNIAKAKKSFLLLSEYNYLEDAFLYLKTNDVLYKSPKKHTKIVQILKKIHNKCDN